MKAAKNWTVETGSYGNGVPCVRIRLDGLHVANYDETDHFSVSSTWDDKYWREAKAKGVSRDAFDGAAALYADTRDTKAEIMARTIEKQAAAIQTEATLTQTQAMAFALLFGDSHQAHLQGESLGVDNWLVRDHENEMTYYTFEDCLRELADEHDFELCAWGAKGCDDL